MSTSPPPKLDRQKTTPFLLKLFYRTSTFHRLEEFAPYPAALPPHLQIYTWPTCSLRELTHLLTSALPNLLPSPSVGTRIAYRLVYPDTRPSAAASNAPGRYLSKELGSVVVGANMGVDGDSNGSGGVGQLDGETDKMLQDVKFVIGDYVSCAIMPPLDNGDIAPAPAATVPRGGGYSSGPSRAAYGRLRDNGYDDGFRSRGGGRGPPSNTYDPRGVPSGEWRRGERIPEGPSSTIAHGRGRGRGRGY